MIKKSLIVFIQSLTISLFIFTLMAFSFSHNNHLLVINKLTEEGNISSKNLYSFKDSKNFNNLLDQTIKFVKYII